MRNIILVGMPGAGKSTLGVLLAKSLGYDFIDTDLIVQQQEGKLLQEIIDQEGMKAFLRAENQALKSVHVKKTVIATGGSAIYCPEGIEHLKSIGDMVYLRLSLETILKRLYNITTRGIAIPKGVTMEDEYAKRHHLYMTYADQILDLEVATIEESVARLEALLK